MIDYVDNKTNTCIFGYGGIDISVMNRTLIFKGIKPPQGSGAQIWNYDCTEKIGDWEYTGSTISVSFNTLDEINFVCDNLKNIEDNQGGSLDFKNVIFDFNMYKQPSMDLVKTAMCNIRLNMISLIAC